LRLSGSLKTAESKNTQFDLTGRQKDRLFFRIKGIEGFWHIMNPGFLESFLPSKWEKNQKIKQNSI